MLSNSPEQIRKKLYEEYEDSLFKLIMHDAAEKEGKLFLEEKEKLKNNLESLPSRETLKRFNQQLDAHFKKSKAYAKRQSMLKALNRIAVAMLAVIVMFFTAVGTVQAVRVRVLNFLIDIQPQYTSFQLKDSGGGSEGGNLVVNWTNTYVPTYIPDGYKVSNITSSESYKRIIFENQQDKEALIVYTESSGTSSPGVNTEDASRPQNTSAGERRRASSPGVDTEDAYEFETVSINGHKGTLMVKDSMVKIVWQIDSRILMVQTRTGKDTAMKIAEGVIYVK